MVKRRERIEKWRAEKKKKEMESAGKENEVRKVGHMATSFVL